MDPGLDPGDPKKYGSGGSGSATLVFRRRKGERAIPEVPGSRLCCGSDTVFSDSELSPTGNFTRQAAGENIKFCNLLFQLLFRRLSIDSNSEETPKCFNEKQQSSQTFQCNLHFLNLFTHLRF
jgi:hypothetical protein